MSPADMHDVIAYLFKAEGRRAEPAAASRGAAIYAGRGGCYDCHAADAQGDTAIGAPNLSDSIWLYGDGSAQAIFDTLEGGRQGICPAWAGRLKPEDILDVSVFVRTLSNPFAARS